MVLFEPLSRPYEGRWSPARRAAGGPFSLGRGLSWFLFRLSSRSSPRVVRERKRAALLWAALAGRVVCHRRLLAVDPPSEVAATVAALSAQREVRTRRRVVGPDVLGRAEHRDGGM